MKINECMIGQMITKNSGKDVLITSANVVYNEIVLCYNFSTACIEAIPWNTEVHRLTTDFKIERGNNCKVNNSCIDKRRC